jgi:hypothetical protein
MRGASEGIITMCASPFVTRGPPSTAISCQVAGPAILKPALQSACDEVLGAQRRLKAVNPTVQTYRDRINRKIGAQSFGRQSASFRSRLSHKKTGR